MSDQLAPGFLVAATQLQDPNFRKAVVLLLQQGADGALGLVINDESPLLLVDLCDDHEIDYSGDPDKRVRKGGPVQPEQGLVLYGDEHEDPEGQQVTKGLHVSASRVTLARLCKLDHGRFHCFSGYAGWGPGQLEREIGEGSWILAPVSADTVFDRSPEEIWVDTLRRLGIDPTSLVPGGDAEA
jgi:putative transcriptional regulator